VRRYFFGKKTMNMNRIIGSHHILFITLDTLRLDVACNEYETGALPTIEHYANQRWEARHSPGTFTYAAHHAFFAGFLPTPVNKHAEDRLFSTEFFGSLTTGEDTWCCKEATWIQGLSKHDYRTVCVGGVGFFNKQTQLGCVLPNLFEISVWSEAMGVTNPASTERQVEWIIDDWSGNQSSLSMTFLNISALHQPNYFYLPGCEKDCIESHAAALRYVDENLKPLFSVCEQRNKPTFVILCSDHGTCYGEDGRFGHRLSHANVWEVPYLQFFIPGLAG
jgi:hypothetical protein